MKLKGQISLILFVLTINYMFADMPLKWDADRITTRELWRSSKSSTDKNGGVTFEFNTRAPWPRFILHPDGKEFWDLSSYRSLAFDAENLNQKTQCEFAVKVNGQNIGNGVLEPGEKRAFLFNLNHKGKQNFDPLFLAIGMPDGFNGGSNVDTSKINSIAFASYYPIHAKYRISNLRACGNYTQNPATASADSFFPFVDAYGQYVHMDWPGKIKKDEDLKDALQKEKFMLKPMVERWNKWGGWANGPQLKASGFFRVEKYQRKWWLVDPDGKLFFSRGVNAIDEDDFISGRERPQIFSVKSRRSDGGFMFFKDNLIKKYGKSFRSQYYPYISERLKSWGFNTVGNWSSPGIYKQRKQPYTCCLEMHKIKNWPKLAGNKFYDVFDPKFAAVMDCLYDRFPDYINDPWCIGVFIGNELKFGDSTFLAKAVIASPASQPAKLEFEKMLKKKYGTIEELNKSWESTYNSWEHFLSETSVANPQKAADDLNAFSSKFVEHFFKLSRDVVKKYSPNTLYLGSRLFCGSDYFRSYLNKAAAKYCDIVSYNLYQLSFDRLSPNGMPDVPVLISECSVGDRSRGRFIAHTDAGFAPGARVKALSAQFSSAARHPQIVGLHHFAFKDQVLTGRWGRGGENYGFGLVDVTDTPYWDFVEANRAFAEKMYDYRYKSKAVEYK
jgi:hypothetical protein